MLMSIKISCGSYSLNIFTASPTIPRMYQIVVFSWDGLNQPEVAVMVFGNQDGDFLFTFIGSVLLSAARMRLCRHIGRVNQKVQSLRRAWKSVRYCLPCAVPTSGRWIIPVSALGKIIELDKALEYTLLFVFRDTASRIGYVEIKHLVVLQLVAKTDTAFLGKLDGIGHQIDDELRQAVTSRNECGIRAVRAQRRVTFFRAIASGRANFPALSSLCSIQNRININSIVPASIFDSPECH